MRGTKILAVENATGSACEQDVDYYPYGGQENDYCTTQVAQHFKFTGKERDAESGLDNFGARYDASSLGRFMTPDWADKPISVPYAKFGDPQTLNLYAYVENSPLNRIDADGHDPNNNDESGKHPSGPCKNPTGMECGPQPQDPDKAQDAINTKPSQPLPPPMAELKTDMNGHTTSLLATDKKDKLTVTTIETRNDLAGSPKVKAGAGDPYTTHDIVGVSNRHAGQDAYGPAGAFIDTGDSRGRDIHGGGTGLPDPMAPQQGWKPTFGCTRGQNEDVIKLGNAITQFQQSNPNVVIPYVRE